MRPSPASTQDLVASSFFREISLDGTGWGEQDQMVNLGKGRVGWADTPNPALTNLKSLPPCEVSELQFTLYSHP